MTIESDASLDRKNLLAQLDHSLWSPLNAIYHYSESLLLGMDGDLSDTARVNVQMIFDKAQSLHTALKKLLAWLPFEAVGLIPAAINITYVLNQAMSMASINFAGGQIHINQDANLDIQVIADEKILYQIISTLLSYLVKDGVTSTINVELHLLDRSVEVNFSAVLEAGTDVPASHFNHQASADLLMSSIFVERMGGQLLLKPPSEGEGFRLVFPRLADADSSNS